MRLRSLTEWLGATARGRRAVPADDRPLPSCEAAPDHEKVAAVGEVLQGCYPDPAEPLDDHLTALMLRLSVEDDQASPPPGRRKR